MPVKGTIRLAAAVFAATMGITLTAIPAAAKPEQGDALARKISRNVTVDGVNRHLIALQRLADRNGRTRVAGSAGHQQSANYIADKVRAAGFDVSVHEFPFVYFVVSVETLTAGGRSIPTHMFTYSKSTPAGGVTAPLVAVPVDATTGCEASDYAGLALTGKIALIKRGGCTFAIKQQLASEAGAIAAIIYNNIAEPQPLGGTLSDPANARIPTVGVNLAEGEALAANPPASVTVDARATEEPRRSFNVLAQTKTGRKDNVVMAGAHLDSVAAGPGINDNGSGSATLLETALQLGGSPKVNNAIRFGWWSAEEFGLVGSTQYVRSLSFEQQLDIALYLNFDMVGSPNAGHFIYDGDDSDGVGAGPGPYGSAQIESAIQARFAAAGVPTEGKDYDSRSDYAEFVAQGIPSGGTFTGAEVIKTAAQAAKWGGRAGVAFDPCYHQACDNLGNIDRVALGKQATAIAYVIAAYGYSTEDVNGVPPRSKRAEVRSAAKSRAALTSDSIEF
ncbi:Zn-dependent M28 family amino/carboxypeptidase [Kibdelosporangium banguiense]|uniref:Zn-dependent M28 family amino/carboxypeptidase n=1 Tax=Kibdelosporangium banguiense TaxID=1365924 RepID=A0ABS4TB32_9PSEU|nr:M28 family metallopeptidase [Kibdelosporangium banguiense]MBP2321625.1 Zn-dependent M28 family amino/carboxypeptidase [Kibdelosporangium banguiense]